MPSHHAKRPWQSSSILGNLAGVLAVLVLPFIPPDARPWLVAVLLANAANRLRIRSAVTFTGPVQVGGETFTGNVTTGGIVGGDVGTLTEAHLVGSPPFVEVVTRASGGVLPETTLQPPDDGPHGGTL
jgi:hypothetical protein